VGPAKLDDVPHDQEVTGKAELLDECELMVDLLVRALHAFGIARPVPPSRPLLRDFA
jgi:hypothetical protein